MKRISGIVLALALAGSAATVWAQGHAPGDAMTDPTLKKDEVIAFIGLKPGQRIADIVAGRFVHAFSAAVGPKGKVYAVMPAEVIKAHPSVADGLKNLPKPEFANVEVLTPAINDMDLPKGIDAVFIRQNYHDLHDKFMGPADVPAFNRHVFEALKPGGVYVVLDHSAPAGTGLADTDTIHRIDEATVKSEVEAAGFKLDGESHIFANPKDDRSKMVFDPAIRGQTDQFLLKFRKPRR
jgi:predicted methyltransferase